MTGLLSLAPFAILLPPSTWTAIPRFRTAGLSRFRCDRFDGPIKSGRYKDVNMAGAATIASVLNAAAVTIFLSSFGGDGGVRPHPA